MEIMNLLQMSSSETVLANLANLANVVNYNIDNIDNTDKSDAENTTFAVSTDAGDSAEVVNFMGGVSFKLDPLRSLKIVMTSMICGESQYYRINPQHKCKSAKNDNSIKEHVIFKEMYESDNYNSNSTANDYVADIIRDALNYDYEGTLSFIGELRNKFLMRLNPQIILVCALHHPNRVEFNKKNPKALRKIMWECSQIPKDWCTQYELLKQYNKPIPSIWKRGIAKKLENISAYHAVKYINGSKTGNKKNADKKTDTDKSSNKVSNKVSIIDLIRITHPRGSKNPIIDQIVKTGKFLSEDAAIDTWERLRSQGKTWVQIINTIDIPHMALLRNLRNILQEFTERINEKFEDDSIKEMCLDVLASLQCGVIGGKQFPFRYYSAYRALKTAKDLNPELLNLGLVCLENCVTISLSTIPALKGRVDCLTDNSASANGTLNSAYGSVKVSEIANLSSLITAFRSEEGGSVWVFGDRLKEYVVDKSKGILEQLEIINDIGSGIGGGTETGVWLFWRYSINNSVKLDNVFIYSDMQAGYSELYASTDQTKDMMELNAISSSKPGYQKYVDVLSLVKTYRERVNNKVNVFSVQVAGYDNVILPDILYRGAILSGWTGKEASMAHEMIKLWDDIESV